MKATKRRIVDLSYKLQLSHIGSCLGAVDIIEDIYNIKRAKDLFVLSSGHAGLALYVVLEKMYGFDAEELFHLHGVHPNRDKIHKIDCSTGSLGQGLPIALGMAMADKEKNVYCLISDGECAEGSIWESLMLAKKQNITNLKVYLNYNGYSAYDKTDINLLINMTKATGFPVRIIRTSPPSLFFFRGLQAHYHVLNHDDYDELVEELDK